LNAPVRYQCLSDDGWAGAEWPCEGNTVRYLAEDFAGLNGPWRFSDAIRFTMADRSTVTVRPLSPERKALRLARAA
jgi:hypothetical protein